MSNTIRAALERLIELQDDTRLTSAIAGDWADAIAAALAAEPVGEGPDGEAPEKEAPCWYNSDMASFWQAGRQDGWSDALARWGHPTPPAPEPEPGEVGELVAYLQDHGTWLIQSGYANASIETRDLGIRVFRAATLLQQLSAPAPAATDEELADCYADAARVAILNRRDYDKALTPVDVLKAQIRAIYDLGCQRGAAQAPDALPAVPVARFTAWLQEHAGQCVELGRPDWAHMVARAATLLQQLSAPAPAVVPPSGYAYRYPDGIRFNNGNEVNGCRPSEAIPYWFSQPPAPAPVVVPVAVAERLPESGEVQA